MRHALVSAVFLIAGSSLTACGGSKKEAESAPDIEVDNEDEFDDGMEMMQEFGGMNEEKVSRTFNRLIPDLTQCLTDAGNGQSYLFGDVAFLIKVNRNGQAEAAHAKSSNLGSHEAEQCMLRTLKASRWPKPVGGLIGLVNYGPMGYDAPSDVRPPVEWTREDIDSTLTDAENAKALYACGRGGPFEITAYVGTNGSVLSAGIAHTDDSGEDTANCLVETIEGMKFPSPGSWRSKVTFTR